MIRKLCNSSVTVLITGESGVGKELLAKSLHAFSPKRSGPFIAANCAALSSGVLESELFGHRRGAFTGAVQSHAGLFEQAHGGTLFLDEIGEIAPFIQVKLLRALQEREIRRVGEAGVRRIDVRFLCATNADLGRNVKQGLFREDLYFRINVVQIRVPPLRERLQDIEDLIAYFYRSRSLVAPRLSRDARTILLRYRWPGNVRELWNELERLKALCGEVDEITPRMLSERLVRGEEGDVLDVRILSEASLPQAVGYLEEHLLKRALVQSNWNKSRTARMLGLSRQGLLKKIKRYGIERDGFLIGEEEELS